MGAIEIGIIVAAGTVVYLLGILGVGRFLCETIGDASDPEDYILVGMACIMWPIFASIFVSMLPLFVLIGGLGYYVIWLLRK